MPYENLYQVRALEDSLNYTISVREAALLVAIDNDQRDQSEIEPELPNDGDYVVGMSPLLEPAGALKIARDQIEKNILKALEMGRMKFSLCARTQDDRVDPIYSLVSGSDIERWCDEHDMRVGEFWMQWQQDENEYLQSLADGIVARRMPATLDFDPSPEDEERVAEFLASDEDERGDLYRKLLAELSEAKQRSRPASVEDEVMNTRKRNTLLTIIGTLMSEMGEQLPTATYKRAQAVSAMTERLGVALSVNTVDTALKDAVAVIGRRH